MQHPSRLSNQELNDLIAEHLFGYQWWRSMNSRNRAIFPPDKKPHWFKSRADMSEPLCTDHNLTVPPYSTSFNDAWIVVMRLQEMGIWTHIRTHFLTTDVRVEMGRPSEQWEAWAATAERAICEAAMILILRDRQEEAS